MKTKFQQGLKRARESGLFVVEPKPNEVQIDLDGIRALKFFAHQLYILDGGGITKGWRFRITASKRANHLHVTLITPQSVSDLERGYLSILLGSDRTREAFNHVRVENGNKYPVAFFEKAKPKVIAEDSCRNILKIIHG